MIKNLYNYIKNHIFGDPVTPLIILIGFLTIFTLSTVSDVANNIRNPETKKQSIDVFKVDSCEYLRYPIGNGIFAITHKGNCLNEIHFHNKQDTLK